MVSPVHLISSVPVTIQGRDGAQLASEGDVYMWDQAGAQYGPEQPFNRLVTYAPAAAPDDFDFVFCPDGSPLWH